MEKSSADHLFYPNMSVSQPEKGYRFSMDPFILAAHVQCTGMDRILDIGCGCGIIPLILAKRYPDVRITGVEIQEELARFATDNTILNGLENRIHILHNDINNMGLSDINGKADIIVSNPPYKPKDTGRLNPDSQKAIARHEIRLDIDRLFRCSKRLLNQQGRLYIIFPAQRVVELVLTMTRYQFSADLIRFVHIKQNAAARLVVFCAAKKSVKPCTIAPPFYVYGSDNKYTNEYAGMFKP